MNSIYEIHDDRFARLIKKSSRLDVLFSGCRWAEGPVYFPAARSLVWSDIPNDRMLRLDECSGAVSIFRQPAGFANGNTIDRFGRMLTCEHGGRRVSRTEFDGKITTLASHFEGRPLNSPNDVVVKSDGSIWFTDPIYGIDSDYEGVKAEREQDGNHVYKLDPETGVLSAIARDFVQPNGLAFSPDETILYVSDTGRSHVPDGPAHIRRLDLLSSGAIEDGGVFAECTAGKFDGIRLDTEGRVWSCADDGVHCYHPDGTLLGKILVPEQTANLCFGGLARNYLYICASTTLYGVRLPVNGNKTF